MRWWDIEAVHRIETEVFAADPWTREQFWSELAQSTRTYVVATMDADVVGYGGVFCLAPDADVQTIAVDRRAQGHGVGTQVLRELIRIAVSNDCSQLMLEVRSDNIEAIALYERFGFERLSTRPGYYGPGIDAHIMRLRPLVVTDG